MSLTRDDYRKRCETTPEASSESKSAAYSFARGVKSTLDAGPAASEAAIELFPSRRASASCGVTDGVTFELVAQRCSGYGPRRRITAAKLGRRRLITAARRIAARAARIAVVDARLAAIAGILPEADVFVALQFAAAVPDRAATSRGKSALLGVDHATQRARITADRGQAAATIDALAIATTLLGALRPGRRRQDGGACQGQDGRPKILPTSVSHDFLLLVKHILASLRPIERPATSSRADTAGRTKSYRFLTIMFSIL
jgi:hypothetical protein